MPGVRTSNGTDRKSVKAIAEVVHRSIMKFTQVDRATGPLINAFALTTPAQAARAEVAVPAIQTTNKMHWDNLRCFGAEALACCLGGSQLMLQSSLFDGVAFDPFSFQEDGLASAEVDVGRRQVL